MGEFNNSILFTGQNNLPSWINPEPVPDWFRQRYGYRGSLAGWTSKLNNNLANNYKYSCYCIWRYLVIL